MGRPPLENPKVPLNLRIDADVLAAFRATGDGWQTRMNDALRDLPRRARARREAMTVKISEYDPTKYLQIEADQIEYLSACAEFNDPKTLVVALGHVARARGGMAQLDSGNPELGTVMKVLAALGLHMTFAPREQAA